MANTKEPLAPHFPSASLLSSPNQYTICFYPWLWCGLCWWSSSCTHKCCMVAVSSCSLLPSLTPALGGTGREKVLRALEGHIRCSVMAEGSGFDISITHPLVALPLWIFCKEAEPKGGHFVLTSFIQSSTDQAPSKWSPELSKDICEPSLRW